MTTVAEQATRMGSFRRKINEANPDKRVKSMLLGERTLDLKTSMEELGIVDSAIIQVVFAPKVRAEFTSEHKVFSRNHTAKIKVSPTDKETPLQWLDAEIPSQWVDVDLLFGMLAKPEYLEALKKNTEAAEELRALLPDTGNVGYQEKTYSDFEDGCAWKEWR